MSSSNASKSADKTQLPFGSLSERQTTEVLFEWKVPDFFDLETGYEDSPTFSCYDSSWFLRMHPFDETEEWMSLHLHRALESKRTDSKDIALTFGIKRKDGILEEIATKNVTFRTYSSVFGRQEFWDREDLIERGSLLLPEDTLTITCRMKDKMLRNVEHKSSRRVKLTELETLSSNFRDLFKSKVNHDVTIKAKGKEFKAHRAVLAARSHVFAAMFEHELSEKETGVVDVEDSDPESFGDFLQYLYTGRIEDISFRSAYHLYVTSDKYDVKELKWFCVENMMENLTVKNFCDVVTMADQYDEDVLLKSAQAFFNKNVGGIFCTEEWEKLLKKNHRLANRLLKEMIPSSEK